MPATQAQRSAAARKAAATRRRQEIVDAAMEMADRLVHTQYDSRHVGRSAGKTLSRQGEAKK